MFRGFGVSNKRRIYPPDFRPLPRTPPLCPTNRLTYPTSKVPGPLCHFAVYSTVVLFCFSAFRRIPTAPPTPPLRSSHTRACPIPNYPFAPSPLCGPFCRFAFRRIPTAPPTPPPVPPTTSPAPIPNFPFAPSPLCGSFCLSSHPDRSTNTPVRYSTPFAYPTPDFPLRLPLCGPL